MTWTPSPEVEVARDAAARLGADRCIIIYTRPDGQGGCVSFGRNRDLCARAKALAEWLWPRVVDYFETVGD